MMKFHAAIATCLATYFVSGIGQESEALLALSKQLRRTEHSLDVMNQLKERKDTDPQSVTALLLSATEPAAEAQVELDRRLQSLQQELSVLHMETEIILGSSGAPAHRAPASGSDKPMQQPAQGATQPAMQASEKPMLQRPSQESPKLVSGLDPRVLAILNNHQQPKSKEQVSMQKQPISGEAMQDAMPKPEAPAATQPKPEPIKLTGYSADPMLQAKSAYRAGLFEDCITILKDQKGSAAEHLRARCLTRLDRLEEAIVSLKRIIKAEGESFLGKRAAKDLEFAQWMLNAKQQLERDSAGEGQN